MADLEYEINDEDGCPTVFEDLKDACAYATARAITHGKVTIDVLTWTEEAAREWGGDEAVEAYREDPEASIFERLEVTVNSLGRIA